MHLSLCVKVPAAQRDAPALSGSGEAAAADKTCGPGSWGSSQLTPTASQSINVPNPSALTEGPPPCPRRSLHLPIPSSAAASPRLPGSGVAGKEVSRGHAGALRSPGRCCKSRTCTRVPLHQTNPRWQCRGGKSTLPT